MSKFKFKIIVFLWGLVFPVAGFSQPVTVSGDILDEKGEGLGFATVALLHPSDSTLASFGITNTKGHFDIRNAKAGEYLLQVAYIGYRTLYRKLRLPLPTGNDIGAVIMKQVPLTLGEVQITGDHVPLLIKKDTIEYNAAAFRTKPDAVAEDLLRKLPGLEVDRAGNIKAVGEDVKNVLVDGKEFFGKDQKVATKNVPADAVKKVQVYDKRSEESEFTGISDGSREKTVNLVLKEDRKKAVFGSVEAGGGTGGHYQAGARVYRFTGASQFAAIGMLNNINQTGFSFSDYLSFNGGIGSISGGGLVQVGITTENNYPVNFGQPVNGLVTSGAAGINFSHEFRKNNRLYVSYLGNASQVNLDQQVVTKNFLPGSTFVQQRNSSTTDENWAHRLSFGWKNRIDSLHQIVFSGGASLTNARGSGESATGSFRNDSLVNSLLSETSDLADRFSFNTRGSYIRKFGQGSSNIKLAGDASYATGRTDIDWQNITRYFSPETAITSSQYQDNLTHQFNAGANLSVTLKTGNKTHLEPSVEADWSSEWINREQGIPGEPDQLIDSLSPLFTSSYLALKPGVSFRVNSGKVRFSATARAEAGRLGSRLDEAPEMQMKLLRLIPSLSFEYEYTKGRRLAFSYQSRVAAPPAGQLMPVVNNINPLALIKGNQSLNPEYRHETALTWWLFDQFSFTSLLTSASFSYVNDQISWNRSVNDSLGQTLVPVNVPDDYSAGASIDFSTPVRKLGLVFHVSLRENWNRAITLINSTENINTNLTHRISVSFDNRKKEKWDINFGGSLTLTNARYSVEESMNNRYFDLGYFADVRFTPNERWTFAATADVVNYNARTFNEMINIPLIGAEISFYFLKYNRGMLTLTGFDLLDRNTGIERVSEMNYLRETRSNIIGRYVMLAFKYRLNKFREQSGLDIKINNRR